MALQNLEFSTEDIRNRINRIYDQFNDRIKEFMNISNHQFAFLSDIPWVISDDGYPDPSGILGKTILLSESGQIIVHIYFAKLTQTINQIFYNFYDFNIANRVCDLYIEFILAHEFAHVCQLVNNRPRYLATREEESGILECNRSYEIEADNCAAAYMIHTYSENGDLIGIIGRKIHVNSLHDGTMIRELMSQIDQT
jgi:hypothetical protein